MKYINELLDIVIIYYHRHCVIVIIDIENFIANTLNSNWSAGNKWVAWSAFWTGASWNMIDYIASSILSTGTWAWIYTFLITASFVPGTIRVHCALWPATRVRISKVVSLTRAHAVVTIGIGSTRWGVAWIGLLNRCYLHWNKIQINRKSWIIWVNVRILHSPTTGEHWVNGSPVYPVMQVQIGMWFWTLHSALKPQEPGHGSLHFSVIQAIVDGQSVLTTHSGLQLGGEPMKFCWQEHAGWLPTALHSELGPQGDGMHGLTGSTGWGGCPAKVKHG